MNLEGHVGEMRNVNKISALKPRWEEATLGNIVIILLSGLLLRCAQLMDLNSLG
jgi:hypothetical protein